MKNIYFILSLLIILSSCNKDSKKENKLKGNYRDKLIARKNDTVYTKIPIVINWGNGNKQEIEVYQSKYDTIINQIKSFSNNRISKGSEYYDLKIWNTEKPNIYKGKVTMHTDYENLKLDKKNTRKLEFAFCEQNKDSMSLKYITSKTSNTIEFEFENYFGNRLQGKLYELVFRDTIIKGKSMLNMRQTELLVDNYPTTINLFLGATSSIKKKKFNPKKLNIKRTK